MEKIIGIQKHEGKVGENFDIDFTHIIRIWPKNLQFLTYEIVSTFESF